MIEPTLGGETGQPDLDRLDTEGFPMAARRKARRSGMSFGRLFRILAIVVLVLVLIPSVLTLLYWPSFVHPVSTLMLRDAVTLQGYDRRWVPLDDIAPVLRQSVIMSEDGQFCSHHGIDLGEMKAVVEEALAGENTRGASTIPMQTVKNLFLWQGRSFIRKAAEAPLAVYADLVLPKRRLLEIYLNIVEWGPGIYGVEAAAQHHFKRSAKELSAQQAALLAVALPNPALRNPAKPSAALRRLANLIQRRAARSGGYVGCVQ